MPPRCSKSAGIGRAAGLAVVLGIGAALTGGASTAGADTPAGNGADSGAEQSSTQSPAGGDADTDSLTASEPPRRPVRTSTDAQIEAFDDASGAVDGPYSDPGAAPSTSLEGVKDTTDDTAEVDLASAAATQAPPVENESASGIAIAAIEPPTPAVPSPTDEAATEYGDIGKWMLKPNGQIADYGGVPYDGMRVLEPVNAIIVDHTSRTALGANWRLNTAMRRSGFPPRLIHSTGFRGLIDDRSYRQQPRGLLAGYSDGFFLLPNNHGRIFGPAPIETSGGYVWSGAFSTEEMALVGGLPRHVYVSSNTAKTALATQLVASGRAENSGMVSLENSYHTATTTTGDHDGFAVVLTLNNLHWVEAANDAASSFGVDFIANRACVGDSASPSGHSCVSVPTEPGRIGGPGQGQSPGPTGGSDRTPNP